MSNVAKLKKKAADFELKKDFAKALAVYVELLDNFDQYAAELDVSLFNRVGDLMLRQGNVADAVDYYERAVVRYVDGGFYNNAIALCNKILRHSPGRASVYYTLGKISAHKGFVTDAKQNFLEYADRMQKAGNLDEAFRSLKEFADLCPGQDDIRLMLADQLSKLERKDEAIEQLQTLWARYHAEGKNDDAQSVLEKIKAIDPKAQPRAKEDARSARGGDLVFLDLGEAPPARPARPALGNSGPPPKRQPPRAPAPAAVADLPLLDSGDEEVTEAKPVAPPPATGRPAAPSNARPSAPPQPPAEPDPEGEASIPPAPLLGLEPTSFGSPPPTPDLLATLDFEATAVEEKRAPPPPSIIEQEASASLIPEHDLLEGDLAQERSQRELDRQSPPDTGDPAAFDVNTGDTFSFDVSHDSSSLDVDIAPNEDAASEVNLWQEQANDFGSSLGDIGEVPPLLRADAIGLDDPLASSDGGRDMDAPPPLFDFDPSLGSEDLSPIPQGPASLRQKTISAERSVETLRASVDSDPDNWSLRRELAEKMLESGDRDGGIHELEAAMMGAERANELDLASSLAEEIARLAPETVRFHQKRVEYAFRTNDKLRLIEAYLALAGALLNAQQAEKARAVYQRVLDLAPDDIRAQAALESIKVEPEPLEAPAPVRKAAPRGPVSSPVRTRTAEPEPSPGGGGFVNLGDLLRVDDGPKSTRMIVDEEEPTGDEEADFADMLKKFKQGIAENVSQEDYQSHYDLGVAFKEMGLVDEAVAEFQKALKAPSNRLPTYEALGQCFIEKEQYGIASTVLARALGEGGYSDEELIGVLYLLGRAAQALNHPDDALAYYQRVFVVDIEFRDVVGRISEVERVAR
jgi:tetratricopeptide (TPR) repeat protein